MVRFLLSLVFLTFAANSDLLAQPVLDEHKKVGCFVDIDPERGCSDMAFYAQPKQPWARCTVAVCQYNTVLEILECSHKKGLKVTNETRTYADVTEVPTGVSGYSSTMWFQSTHICGQVWTCSCDERAVDQSCLWGSQGEDYAPKIYFVGGAMDCTGE